jgi:ParB/RepB/Spo0J family partition protein
VRPFRGKYVLVFGLRRYRAATAAGLTEVPCVILAADDSHALLLNLIENLQREQLRGSERLKAIERLAATGLGVRELSRRTGFAPSTISRWLRIDRHPMLRAAVETGLVDVSRATILVEAPEADMAELLHEAPDLSTSELRDRVAARRRRAVDPRVDGNQSEHVRAAISALQRVSRHVSELDLVDQLRNEVTRVLSL